jgi:hypothetical protein
MMSQCLSAERLGSLSRDAAGACPNNLKGFVTSRTSVEEHTVESRPRLANTPKLSTNKQHSLSLSRSTVPGNQRLKNAFLGHSPVQWAAQDAGVGGVVQLVERRRQRLPAHLNRPKKGTNFFFVGYCEN